MKEDFLKLQKDFEKLIKDKEKAIVKNYASSYKKLRKKLSDIYDKYEKDGVISKDELRKYNRLKALDLATAKTLIDLYSSNKSLIRQTLKEVIEDTKNSSFTIINNRVSITPIKRKFDSTEIINQEIAGKIWTQRIKHYGDNFVYDVHSIIRQGLERGDTYTTVSKSLKSKFGQDLKRAVTIARTESARVQAYTKNATMEEVNKQVSLIKTWRTMKDEGVRRSHQAMEGVTVKFDEEFTLPSGATCMYPKSTGYPEEDINCRCYLEYKVDKNDDKDENLEYNKDDIIIHKSLSAAAFRDTVKLPDGTYTKVTEGTKITKVVVFAGGKTNKKVKVAKYLAKQYNNAPNDWRKVRGEGFVDVNEESLKCELHWFESKQTGRVKMKVKRWFDNES
ncbi:phage putative head morphogenesis protein [Peptoniphilus sp. ING2-D1G]|nr:phage putative head morphogenesis protein [Peptoniphilus sp. ING2-D1G]